MKVFLTISAVLSLALLTAGQAAEDTSQVVFGGHRPNTRPSFNLEGAVTKGTH